MKSNPCQNPNLPRVVLICAPDVHVDLGKGIPISQGVELAVSSGGHKFMCVCTDQKAELIDGELTIFCHLQKI